MTIALEQAFGAIVEAVAAADEIDGRPLTSHWPLVGRDFDHGVLVVGQAVYGWIPTWTQDDVQSEEGRRAIVDDTRNVFVDRDDPMDWLSGHWVANSPFWRTAHEIVDEIAPGPGDWYSRLAWANLYPCAPNDVKGNPEGSFRAVQTRPAAAFLDLLIDELDPRLVVVLAGPFIRPFVEPLGLNRLARAQPPFTFVGVRKGRPWICGMHPGGAQRRGWPARTYAKLILEQARTLSVHGARSTSSRSSQID